RSSLCFFFQAEDGIRDRNVTGVQTCALPIWFVVGLGFEPDSTSGDSVGGLTAELSSIFNWNIFMLLPFVIILWGAFAKKPIVPRSEERRVGKECRSRMSEEN